jgi:hypothetical protein
MKNTESKEESDRQNSMIQAAISHRFRLDTSSSRVDMTMAYMKAKRSMSSRGRYRDELGGINWGTALEYEKMGMLTDVKSSLIG